jgi:Holliday junction resolvase-like predicted endonuclease
MSVSTLALPLPHLEAYDRGLWAEWMACQHYLKAGWRLMNHRHETPFAEIDLLFERRRPLPFARVKREMLIVEVKSGGLGEWTHFRVRARQKQRLRAARAHLEACWRCDVGLTLAVVSHCGKVEALDEFFC